MAKPEPFDPDRDFDAIAELAREQCATVALRVIESVAYARASKTDQVNGFVAGMMVGCMGAIVACTAEGTDDKETREVLRKHMDYWFDRGLEANGREPLTPIDEAIAE